MLDTTQPEALLTTAEMAEADRLAVARGVAGIRLMEAAGRAVADAVCERFSPRPCAVFCGPGNNGGDGYVVARVLRDRGWDVWVETLADPAFLRGDAAMAHSLWSGPSLPISAANPMAELFVDALFGAGLTRPLDGDAARLAAASARAPERWVAVDVPSGIEGTTGRALGPAFRAALTVTFFRRKPAHLLMPAKAHMGEVVVADIGIPAAVLDAVGPRTFANGPGLWTLSEPAAAGHKYKRGHALSVSGGAWATGAARLAAMGALRAGAGLVTVASPTDALAVNAAHLTAIMLARSDGAPDLTAILADARKNAVVLGPGLGVGADTCALVAAALASPAAVVLDADALTSFESDPGQLFARIRGRAGGTVLTPHEGEFGRLFPGLIDRGRLDAAQEAAASAGAVIVLKGPDTVIAAPDGRAAINDNAPPWLATAGSGDVLAGIVCGLMAQGMEAFAAAAAGVWLHGAAGAAAGPGLIAEDLPSALPGILAGHRARA